jgi:hypothetical protein
MLTEHEWKPTRYEVKRALDASVIGFKDIKDNQSGCLHGLPYWEDCVDCDRAILEFERKAGRNPLDPRQVLQDRLDECTRQRDKARETLAELEGPVNGWRLACLAALPAGVVYGISYISLAASLATATFFVILTMIVLVEGVRRTQIAIREAKRDLDEWERLWFKAVQALEDD